MYNHGEEGEIIDGVKMRTLTEADSKAKLIYPVLHSRGWTEHLIRREETPCGIDIIEGKAKRKELGKVTSERSWRVPRGEFLHKKEVN